MSTETCPYTPKLDQYLDASNDGKNFILKHLFFAENPLKESTYFYNTDKYCKRSSYFTQVYKGIVSEEGGKSKKKELAEMWDNGVLVWDIFHHKGVHKISNISCDKCNVIHAGHKINSDDRNNMITSGCSLHAFQSSVQALNELDIEVDKNLNIYFMMPQLTSLPIFNFYNKNSEKLKIKGIEVSKKMRRPNPLVTQVGYEQEIFPRHMINVIGGSNTPRANLVKHAFDQQRLAVGQTHF